MELWIRSQDKKILEKCEDLFSAYYSSKKSYAICSHKNMVTLGIYKSEERTLEVLDEIQNILRTEPLVIVGSNEEKIEYKELSTYVYQMPEE